MIRPIRVSVPLLAAFVLATAGQAQSSPVSAQLPAAAPATPAPTPKRDRPISDNLASTLAASMPKFNPPPKPRPEDEDVDLREVDKPRNAIIRLPNYTVRERKPPVFRERDIYNQTNRTNLSLSRNPGLKFGNFFGLNRAIAFAMYAEEERLENMAGLEDTAESIGRADPAAGAYIKRVSAETFMRSSDFGSSRLEP